MMKKCIKMGKYISYVAEDSKRSLKIAENPDFQLTYQNGTVFSKFSNNVYGLHPLRLLETGTTFKMFTKKRPKSAKTSVRNVFCPRRIVR